MFGNMSLTARLGYIITCGGLMFLVITGSDAFLRQRNVALFAINVVLLVTGMVLLVRDDYIKSRGWNGLWSLRWSSWRSSVGNMLITLGFSQLTFLLIFISSTLPFQPSWRAWWLLPLLGSAALVAGIVLILTERGPKQA